MDYAKKFRPQIEAAIDQLRAIGAYFHGRGWSLGTSSNYSVVVDRDPLVLLVTASGKDKSRLTMDDFVLVGPDGRPLHEGGPKSSAETLLHVAAAELPECGAVLHTHSVWATVLSHLAGERGGLQITGYEMLKGLAGVRTHQHTLHLEIFPNTQDIPHLAERVRGRLNDPEHPLRHAYLIDRHGMYTWGADLAEACRQVEILEFLLECVGRTSQLRGELPTSGSAR